MAIRDVNGTLLDDVEKAFRLAEVGLDLDSARQVARDAIDTGRAGEEFWRSQPNPGDEELKQALLSRQLVDIGRDLERYASVRLNSRSRRRMVGEIRRSAARGSAIRFTTGPADYWRTTAVGRR
jgi:hypothetical protein